MIKIAQYKYINTITSHTKKMSINTLISYRSLPLFIEVYYQSVKTWYLLCVQYGSESGTNYWGWLPFLEHISINIHIYFLDHQQLTCDIQIVFLFIHRNVTWTQAWACRGRGWADNSSSRVNMTAYSTVSTLQIMLLQNIVLIYSSKHLNYKYVDLQISKYRKSSCCHSYWSSYKSGSTYLTVSTSALLGSTYNY